MQTVHEGNSDQSGDYGAAIDPLIGWPQRPLEPREIETRGPGLRIVAREGIERGGERFAGSVAVGRIFR